MMERAGAPASMALWCMIETPLVPHPALRILPVPQKSSENAPGRDPHPETLTPKPSPRLPKPETRIPRPETRKPRPETRNPNPESRDPNPETRDLKSEKWRGE